YISTGFLFDMCSTLPLQDLISLLRIDHSTGIVFQLLDMLRLWRLGRTREGHPLQLFLDSVHKTHIDRYPDPEKTWIGAMYPDFKEVMSLRDRYVISIYWSISTLTFAGYGDLHAENTREMFVENWTIRVSIDPLPCPLVVNKILRRNLFSIVVYNTGLLPATALLKVPEMEAEYFPPKADVILENQTPTDFYILVSGAVVSNLNLLLSASEFVPFDMARP
ncbi:hypothetical protein C3L33_05997, partial [Rhododendron williamsianum]